MFYLRIHVLNIYGVCKLLQYKRSITYWDMWLLENSHICGDISHHPILIIFLRQYVCHCIGNRCQHYQTSNEDLGTYIKENRPRIYLAVLSPCLKQHGQVFVGLVMTSQGRILAQPCFSQWCYKAKQLSQARWLLRFLCHCTSQSAHLGTHTKPDH